MYFIGSENKQNVEFSDNTMPNMKDLYDRYKQCRDFELERFWKNSIFVWTFLTLCFTALGFLCNNYFKGKFNSDYYIATSIVALFGCAGSIIWVWMAQGLKAWYKVFEHAIWKMEDVDNYFKYNEEYLLNKFCSATGNDLLDGKPYSPSKIVILTGFLILSFWVVVFVLNFLSWGDKCLGTLCIELLLVSVVILFLPSFDSSSLRDKQADDLFWKIKNDINANKSFLLDSICVEVKDKEVLFWCNKRDSNVVFSKIKEHLKNVKSKEENDARLSYNRIDLETYYCSKSNGLIESIESVLKSKNVQFDNVEFYNNKLHIILKKKQYNKDIEIITIVSSKL